MSLSSLLKVSILDRYLGGVILQYTLITMLVLLGLFTFVNFLEELGDLAGDYTLGDAVLYVALTIPRSVYELFPMAALLGSIIGLSLLANDSELIVMRASGVSVGQITVSALKTGAVFVVAAMLIGEFVAPPGESRAARVRGEVQDAGDGLWMRDAQTFIKADKVLPDLTMLGITMFDFAPDKTLTRTKAADAVIARGELILNDVMQTRVDGDGNTEHTRRATLHRRTNAAPPLSVFLLEPDQLSLRQLHAAVTHLTATRQRTAPYQLAFWSKLILPLSVAVMVVLAIPFVFVNLRAGTLGRSLFVGIMLGIGFYAVTKSFGFIALAYHLPPLLGAALPPAVFLIFALAMVRRIE